MKRQENALHAADIRAGAICMTGTTMAIPFFPVKNGRPYKHTSSLLHNASLSLAVPLEFIQSASGVCVQCMRDSVS